MTHIFRRALGAARPASMLAALFAALLLATQPVAAQSQGAQSQGAQSDGAQQPERTPESVVATVNGDAITHGDVVSAAESLGPQYVANLPSLYDLLLERLVDLRLVQQAALKAGLDEDPAVTERLEELRRQVIRDVYLERSLNDAVTEAALQDRYAKYLEENPAESEIKARHILLESEEDAKAVIQELDGGADFAALARERSTGPSGAEGGDLGYFTRDVMVPEFSEAAFALEPGSYSKAPIQTQFGWHVILVEDKRDTQQPSFEDLREDLSNEIRQEAARSLIETLRSEAEIVMPEASSEAPAAAPAGNN